MKEEVKEEPAANPITEPIAEPSKPPPPPPPPPPPAPEAEPTEASAVKTEALESEPASVPLPSTSPPRSDVKTEAELGGLPGTPLVPPPPPPPPAKREEEAPASPEPSFDCKEDDAMELSE